MSKGLFRSHNKVGQTWSFQTSVTSGSTFDPLVGFSSGSDRVSWDLGIGGGYVAGNSLSYTYSGDTGTTKTITLRTNRLSKLTSFRANEDDVSGHVDFTGWDHMSYLQLHDNPSMTGITNTPSVNTISNYEVDLLYSTPSPGLVGTLDVSMLSLGGRFYAGNQPVLTKIDHGSTPQSGSWIDYWIRQGGLTGNHDMSMFTNLGGDFQIYGHSALTGVTHTSSPAVFTFYYLHSCDITGNHNMPFANLGGDFRIQSNSNLTSITHSASTQNFTRYWAQSCKLTGDLDLSMLTGLGGDFQVWSNGNLTSITHTASTQVFDTYRADACGLIGNHDMSMLPGLGGYFGIEENGGLTGITHTASTEVFTKYSAHACGLIGNHDVSMFPNLGGLFRVNGNPSLTGITNTTSTQLIQYWAYQCNLMGELDVSMFPSLMQFFNVSENGNLTSILHTGSTEDIDGYVVFDCDLTGTLDVSMLTTLGSFGGTHFWTYGNDNLTNISFPLTTGKFADYEPTVTGRAFALHSCDLGYVNFLPLSGASMEVDSTFGASIGLQDNAMTTEEVNHILVDFSGMSNTYNPAGWAGVTLDISGTNAAPDNSSGGYDGLAAIVSLTGASNNWNITSTAPFSDTYSVQFDGITAYASTAGDVTELHGLTEFSLSLWVKFDTLASAAMIINKFIYHSTSGLRQAGWGLYPSAGDMWFLLAPTITDTANDYYRAQGFTWSTGTWYHIVVTYDGTESLANKIKLYQNTVVETTFITSASLASSMTNSTAPVTMGNWSVGTVGLDWPFGGYLDEVAIFDTVLSPSDITAIYNSGVPADLASYSPINWWRMGDPGGTSEYPTLTDVGSAGDDSTMQNQASGDIVADVP